MTKHTHTRAYFCFIHTKNIKRFFNSVISVNENNHLTTMAAIVRFFKAVTRKSDASDASESEENEDIYEDVKQQQQGASAKIKKSKQRLQRMANTLSEKIERADKQIETLEALRTRALKRRGTTVAINIQRKINSVKRTQENENATLLYIHTLLSTAEKVQRHTEVRAIEKSLSEAFTEAVLQDGEKEDHAEVLDVLEDADRYVQDSMDDRNLLNASLQSELGSTSETLADTDNVEDFIAQLQAEIDLEDAPDPPTSTTAKSRPTAPMSDDYFLSDGSMEFATKSPTKGDKDKNIESAKKTPPPVFETDDGDDDETSATTRRRHHLKTRVRSKRSRRHFPSSNGW